MLKLPFSILPVKTLKGFSHLFYGVSKPLYTAFPSLGVTLKQAELETDTREYLALCLAATSSTFLIFILFSWIFLFLFGIGHYFAALFILLLFSFFVFFQQIMFPKLIASKRIKGIDRNLLAATQNILVQLNSGVSLFDVLVSISKGDYGEVSREFSKAVREISAGKDQIAALEEITAISPSVYFRRTIWQIINGMKAGADMSGVMKEAIRSLSEQQAIQLQRYGNQLNPLAMFYMLVAVIIPSLGMTFLIILSSFLSMPSALTKVIFWGLYGFVFFFQVMFLGIIRSRRPSLLGDE